MHKIIPKVGEKSLTCSCGKTFKTRHKLGRHVHKWNAKTDLQERSG